jgi:hypothetical protein
MEIGNCKLSIAGGSGVVQLLNITPAEALLLDCLHKSIAVPKPVHDVSVVRNEQRTYMQERKRLFSKYGARKDGKHIVDYVFPGETGTLPEKFADLEPKAVAPPPPPAKPVQPTTVKV